MAKQIMPGKGAPFLIEDWPSVFIQGLSVMNRNNWFPAVTLMIGNPGETDEDYRATLDFVARHTPPERPRYLMGVGRPIAMVDAVAAGPGIGTDALGERALAAVLGASGGAPIVLMTMHVPRPVNWP